MNLTRIPVPTWACPPSVDVEPEFGTAEYARIQAQREALLATLDVAVAEWLAEHAVDTREGSFPSRDRLTGEYYLGDEHYWVNDEPWFAKVGRSREVCFVLRVRCLEVPLRPAHLDCDYLGLDLQFSWDAEVGAFTFQGIDSSSI